jgi:ABC-type multidrug transport system permease subunit
MPKIRPAIVELASTRFKEFLRETEALFWVFAFPILLALALGFAFREKAPDKIPIGVVAGAHAQARLELLARSPALLPRTYSAEEGARALRTGKISLLVEDGQAVVFRFDPTRPDSRMARLEANDALQRGAGRKDLITTKDVRSSEPGARYIDFLIPGLIGMNLMGTGMWSIGFNVVTARSRKLLKRLVATPMRRSEYLAAQFLARIGFLVLELATVVIFARLVFGVRVTGSYGTFALICFLGAMTFSAIGLLIASRVTTIEGVSGLMNLVMMPMWICSGVFFSYERFPDAVKPLIRALPLTAINDALRGVINEGLTLTQVLPQIAILLAWTVVSFVVGLKIFRWI